MSTKIDVEDVKQHLDRMKLRLEQMVLDAKKTGLQAEETKKRLLTDLEQRYDDVTKKVEAYREASAERAEATEKELAAAWDDLKTHFDRIARGPAD
jgi:septation ring formation regulator EzrA